METFLGLLDATENQRYTSNFTWLASTDSSAAKEVWKVGSPLLMVVGTLGNLLSILVLTRKKLRNITTMFYLTVLAFADLAVLYTGLVRLWLDNVFDFYIRLQSDLACKLHMFLVYYAIGFSVWVLVAVTVDRCLYVSAPFLARRWCNLKQARIVVFIIACVLFAFNMHYLFTISIISRSSSSIVGNRVYACYTSEDPRTALFIEKIWPWLDFCLVCLIPFSIMVVCNALIIRQLVISAKRLKAHSGINTGTNDSSVGNNVHEDVIHHKNRNTGIYTTAGNEAIPTNNSCVRNILVEEAKRFTNIDSDEETQQISLDKMDNGTKDGVNVHTDDVFESCSKDECATLFESASGSFQENGKHSGSQNYSQAGNEQQLCSTANGMSVQQKNETRVFLVERHLSLDYSEDFSTVEEYEDEDIIIQMPKDCAISKKANRLVQITSKGLTSSNASEISHRAEETLSLQTFQTRHSNSLKRLNTKEKSPDMSYFQSENHTICCSNPTEDQKIQHSTIHQKRLRNLLQDAASHQTEKFSEDPGRSRALLGQDQQEGRSQQTTEKPRQQLRQHKQYQKNLQVASPMGPRHHGPQIPRRPRLPSEPFNRRFRISSVTITLLAVSALFWLLTSPIVIFVIGYSYWRGSNSAEEEERLALGWSLVNMLHYTNNSVHFFLYCLTGPSFRKELMAMCRRSPRRRGKVHNRND